MQPRQTNDEAAKTLQWLAWADEDYLAARSLLLSDSVVQGAGFSTTAVEKYLKAIQTLRGMRPQHTHDVVRLYERTKNAGDIPRLNESYLRALVKAYKMRYPDDLGIGFNLSVAQVQWLAELDASVYALRQPFHFEREDGPRVVTQFDVLLKNRDARLTDRNAAFGFCKRQDLFASPSRCVEFRVLGKDSMMYVTYQANVPDSSNFDVEALKPGSAPSHLNGQQIEP